MSVEGTGVVGAMQQKSHAEAARKISIYPIVQTDQGSNVTINAEIPLGDDSASRSIRRRRDSSVPTLLGYLNIDEPSMSTSSIEKRRHR